MTPDLRKAVMTRAETGTETEAAGGLLVTEARGKDPETGGVGVSGSPRVRTLGPTGVGVTVNSSDAPSAGATLLPSGKPDIILHLGVLKEQFSCLYEKDGWMFYIILQGRHFLSSQHFSPGGIKGR